MLSLIKPLQCSLFIEISTPPALSDKIDFCISRNFDRALLAYIILFCTSKQLGRSKNREFNYIKIAKYRDRHGKYTQQTILKLANHTDIPATSNPYSTPSNTLAFTMPEHSN